MYAECFEKLTFLTPCYTHVRVPIRVLEMLTFRMTPKMIKVRNFLSATISDMKLFAVPLLKKKPDKVIFHVGTNDASHFISDEMFKNLKNFVF